MADSFLTRNMALALIRVCGYDPSNSSTEDTIYVALPSGDAGEEAIEELREALPGLTVEWTGNGDTGSDGESTDDVAITGMVDDDDIAPLVGLSAFDKLTNPGEVSIDWSGDEPAEGAPVFLVDGWFADDGNCEVHYSYADSGRKAAREYVDGGDWGDRSDGTIWVRVSAWQEVRSVDSDGQVVTGRACEDSHTIALDPDEPECPEGEHDWQSPHEIVGGIKSNPGVWGNGGGVIITEVCMRCGCGRHTDTWAQDPDTGEQGLRSVRYEPGEFADEIGGESCDCECCTVDPCTGPGHAAGCIHQ